MVENPALKMSAIVDCGSATVILRLPFVLAAQMLKNCPESADKEELMSRVKAASARSKEFSRLIKEVCSVIK